MVSFMMAQAKRGMGVATVYEVAVNNNINVEP